MPHSAFRVEYVEFDVPRTMKVGEKVLADITVKNTSDVAWPSKPNLKNLYAVNLAYHWINKQGIFVVFDGIRTPLPEDLFPGNSVKLVATIQAPNRRGKYILEITLVQEGHAWFPERGGEKLTIPVNVK